MEGYFHILKNSGGCVILLHTLPSVTRRQFVFNKGP